MSKKRNYENLKFDQNKLKFYFGIPHCHSSYSTGRGKPIELFEYAAKIGLNFLFLTDHNNYLSETINYRENSITKWQASVNSSIKAKKNLDNFLPFIGFEFNTSPYGELNLINSNTFFTGTIKDFRLLTLWMLNNQNSIISINHPHKNILLLPYDPNYNKIINSIEVTNGNPDSKITHHDKYYFTLLDRGWQLGAINGQDNHKINFADCENLTAVIANDLTRESIIQAFREHRTYSTESKFLKLVFTIDDTFMGQTLHLTEDKIKINVSVDDIRNKIKEIQIISYGGKVIKRIENINLNSIKYIYEHKTLPEESWYVIRILQENNKTALSSPIFTKK